MVTMNCDLCEARGEQLRKTRMAARRVLDCLIPGVVLTIGRVEIDHTELNDARAALEQMLK